MRIADLSIRRKLMGMIVLTSTIALATACVAFILLDWVSTRETMVSNVDALARVVAVNSISALEFEDDRAAEITLAALAAEPQLVSGAIYRLDGTVLATFARDGRDFVPPAVQTDGHTFDDNLHLYRHVEFDGRMVGTVYVCSGLEELEARRGRYVQLATIFIAASLLVAFVVAGVLHPLVSRPIMELVKAARLVRAERDYSVRVPDYGRDEVGTLISAFNDMLGEIKTRDEALRQARDQLAERARQLQTELGERQRAEEARRKAENELEAQKALGVRADRLRSLGEMAAGITHELNQPLVGVRGLAEHLLIGMERGWAIDEEKMRERLGGIVDQADRMTHIIEHVRMFARESGRPEMSEIDVNDVVRSGMELLREQFRSHGLALTDSLTSDLPRVLANPFSLEEVLLNLLTNARDAVEEVASENGTPGVVVRTGMSAVDGVDQVMIQIEDNGAGIDDDILSKVFDPFFTTKEPDRGTGLGLSICKSIVEQFGGAVAIATERGHGTIVTVSIPTPRGVS